MDVPPVGEFRRRKRRKTGPSPVTEPHDLKRNGVYPSAVRMAVRNVYSSLLTKECLDGPALAMTAQLLSIPAGTVHRMLDEPAALTPEPPANRTPRRRLLPSADDDEDAVVYALTVDFVVNVIVEHHALDVPVTIAVIYELVMNKLDLPDVKVGEDMFREWMKCAGFRWAEHADGVAPTLLSASLPTMCQTWTFLKEFNGHYATDEEPIVVFDDESYIRDGHMVGHSWYVSDRAEMRMPIQKSCKGRRYCFQAVLGPDGLIPGSVNVFEGGGKDDYHSAFTAKGYYDWFVGQALPAVKKAYPNRKIVWVSDSASYHLVTRLGMHNKNASGVVPTNKSDLAAACRALKMDVTGAKMNELRQWAHSNFHLDPVLPDIAYREGVHLLYQPPSSSQFNAIERVWAWVKNKIATDHPPTRRTFRELRTHLDKGLADVTFSVDEEGDITPPTRHVDATGLYDNTMTIYKESWKDISKWLTPPHHQARMAYCDARLDANERPRKAGQAAENMHPSPSMQKILHTPGGTPLTETGAIVARIRRGRGSVRSTDSAEGEDQVYGSPVPLDFDQMSE